MSNEVKTVTVRMIADVDAYRAAMASAGATTASASAGIDSSLKSAGSSITSFGKSLTKDVTPGALAAGAAFMVASNQFLGGTNAIRQETGATGAALDGLTQSMRNVGSEVPASLTQIGTAMGIIADKTGLTGPPLEELTRQILELQHMGQDVDATQIISTFNQWGVATRDQSTALNDLFRISQVTGSSVSTLSGQLQQFAPPLQALGYSFQQSALLLGNLNKEGAITSQVLMGLRVGFATFAKEGKDPASALQSIITQISQLGPGVEAADLAMTTFGKRGGPALYEAIIKGAVSTADLTAQLATNTDTIDKAAQHTFTFADQIKILVNDIEGAIGPWAQFAEYAAFGVALLGPLTVGVGTLATALAALGTSAAADTVALVAMYIAEGDLGAAAVVLTGILGSQAVALGVTGAALALIVTDYISAQHAASQMTDSLQDKIDFTNYTQAAGAINTMIAKQKELAAEFQGNPVQVALAKTTDMAGWAEYVTLTNQLGQNISHINSEATLFKSLGHDLGMTADQAASLAASLHVDPTAFASSQGQFDALKTVMAAVKDGTISVADAQAILSTSIKGATLSAQQQAQQDQATQQSDQDIATAAKGLLDAQTSLTSAQQSAKDAEANLNETRREGAQLDLDAKSAKLDLVDAQKALNDAESEGASLQRSASEAGLDVQSAKLDVTDAQAQLTKDSADPTKTAEDRARDQIALEQAQLRVGDATDRATQAQQKQAGQGEDVARAALGVQSAQQKVADTQDAISKHATDVQKAEQQVETAYYQTSVAASALAVAQAQVDSANQATQYQIAQGTLPSLEAFAGTLSPTDPLRANLEGYIGQLESIPPDQGTTVTLDTAAAQVALKAWEAQLAGDKAAGKLDWLQGLLTPGPAGTPVAATPATPHTTYRPGTRAAGGGVGMPTTASMDSVAENGPELLSTSGHRYLLMPPGQSGYITPTGATQAMLAHTGPAPKGGDGGFHVHGGIQVYGNQPATTARDTVYELRKARKLRKL